MADPTVTPPAASRPLKDGEKHVGEHIADRGLEKWQIAALKARHSIHELTPMTVKEFDAACDVAFHGRI